MGTDLGLSARESRQARVRAEPCDLFVLFERALTRGDVAAGHVDALAMAIRDLNDEQRFGLVDREERLLEAAMRMRVDDFVRHCRVQAAMWWPSWPGQRLRTRLQRRMLQMPMRRQQPVRSKDEPMEPAIDPQVVEYLRQRDGSKVRRWRDVETGMCMTLIALDPIRDAMLKTAFDAHLNALRADGSTSGMAWRQVEVEAFMRTIAGGVRPTQAGAGISVTGGRSADLGDLRDLRTAARANVSPISSDAETTVPEICVVTTLDRLLDDCCTHGLCETSDGQALAAASLRRMSCDAVVYPTVLGGSGEVLDSGRAQRTVRKQRRHCGRCTACGHPGAASAARPECLDGASVSWFLSLSGSDPDPAYSFVGLRLMSLAINCKYHFQFACSAATVRPRRHRRTGRGLGADRNRVGHPWQRGGPRVPRSTGWATSTS